MTAPLFSKSSLTVLVDAGATQFRVDLRRRGDQFKVLRIIEQINAPSETDLDDSATDYFDPTLEIDTGTWITELLKKRPSASKNVVILSSKVGAAISEIPRGGMGEQEESVAIEIEALTGQSIAESQWTWRRLPSTDGFTKIWGIAVRFPQLISWREAVDTRRGSRILCVGHPGGLALSADTHLEVWDGLSLYSDSTKGKRELKGWNGIGSEREMLADPLIQSSIVGTRLDAFVDRSEQIWTDHPSVDVHRLDSGKGIEHWANALAQGLSSQNPGRDLQPWLTIPKRQISTQTIILRTAFLTAVTIGCLTVYHRDLIQQRDSLQQQVDRLRVPVDSFRKQERQVRDLKSKLRRLEMRPQEIAFDVAAHQHRLQELLATLSSAADSDILLREISASGFEVHIRGLSATPDGAANYTRALGSTGRRAGWQASLVERKGLMMGPAGGPWTFSISLQPVSPPTSDAFVSHATDESEVNP